MKNISDLQIGKAGEYLVCADLILKNHVAFPSEQGLPFDVIFEYKNKLLKVQVKTTRGPKNIDQRKSLIPAFVFHIGLNGRLNRRKQYDSTQVDMFALVDLSTKQIAYIPYQNIKTTMNFRVPALKGSYHDEQAEILKTKIIAFKKSGKSIAEIIKETGLSSSVVYKYSANVSIEQKGTNAGVYFDQFTLESCLKKMKL